MLSEVNQKKKKGGLIITSLTVNKQIIKKLYNKLKSTCLG